MSRNVFRGVSFALVLGLLGSFVIVGRYNDLVRLDEDVAAEWQQVEDVYRQRADLVPALVETVGGTPDLETNTVAAARAALGGPPTRRPGTADEMKEFQQAQERLSAAITGLLDASADHPELVAATRFRELQAELEGSEDRIAAERRRYNDVAREFNRTRATFPTNVVASLLGRSFASKAYLPGQASAAPTIIPVPSPSTSRPPAARASAASSSRRGA